MYSASIAALKFQSTPPAREATCSVARQVVATVFQSTPPAREATDARRAHDGYLRCFNPRLRTGGDTSWAAARQLSECFNPRLRTGGDAHDALTADRMAVFQSTPPHGRRRRALTQSYARSACFNPRLRTGGDRRPSVSGSPCVRFNPRLRTGGDARSQALRSTSVVSIHASAREATQVGRRSHVDSGFNPRLRTGGDAGSAAIDRGAAAFQSTPPHGRRRPSRLSSVALGRFNPRLRTGGDHAARPRVAQ